MAYQQGVVAVQLGGGATLLSTAATDFTGCNFLAMMAAWPGGSGPLVSFGDSKTNSWVTHPSGVQTITSDGSNAKIEVWYCTSPIVDAAQTFNFQITASDSMILSVIGLSGRGTSVEGASGAVEPASVTSHSAGSTGAVSAGDDVLGFFSDSEAIVGGRPLTYTAGSGWTLPVATLNMDSRQGMNGGIQYRTNVSAGSYSQTWTSSGSNTGGGLTLAVRTAVTNTGETPPAGTLNVTGNTPNAQKITNTVLTPVVARHGGQVLEPDRRIIVSERRIFLPSRRAA